MDFARANVYMVDNQMIEMAEEPDYPPETLISDIGGQLDLWVRMGVVTL